MPGHGVRPPLRVMLTVSGSKEHAPRKSNQAAHREDHPRAREVYRSTTQTPIDSALCKPATPPNPICIEAIRQCYPEAVENEVFPRPPLRHRAGGNRRSGIHENNNEEEEQQHPDITDGAVQEKAIEAEHAIREWYGSLS